MDPRQPVALYYDLCPVFPADIPFYLEQVPRPHGTILELGCGTGRVSVALAPHVAFLHGVDVSEAMLDRCRHRLQEAGFGPSKATTTLGDITQLRLEQRFDFIIAPYRVFQNLITETDVAGFFATVRSHLAVGGQCILNTFRPRMDAESIVNNWSSGGESLDWEAPLEDGHVACYVRRSGVTPNPLVIHPELIYRKYRGTTLIDEAVLEIAMRCWYPEELLARVRSEGFAVGATWGGYAGEVFGIGEELVVKFADA